MGTHLPTSTPSSSHNTQEREREKAVRRPCGNVFTYSKGKYSTQVLLRAKAPEVEEAAVVVVRGVVLVDVEVPFAEGGRGVMVRCSQAHQAGQIATRVERSILGCSQEGQEGQKRQECQQSIRWRREWRGPPHGAVNSIKSCKHTRRLREWRDQSHGAVECQACVAGQIATKGGEVTLVVQSECQECQECRERQAAQMLARVERQVDLVVHGRRHVAS